MLTVCLTLINDDEDKKSFEQLVKKFEKSYIPSRLRF